MNILIYIEITPQLVICTSGAFLRRNPEIEVKTGALALEDPGTCSVGFFTFI
jgi:hypothetical protein